MTDRRHNTYAGPPDEGGGSELDLADQRLAANGDTDHPHSHARGGKPRKGLSEILTEIAADNRDRIITVGDLMRLLKGRAGAALILVFAFPNALPAIPGTSGILGLPLLYLTYQLMMNKTPWLPKLIAGRGMSGDKFQILVGKLVPYLQRTERLLRPRWRWLTSGRGEQILGLVCFVLAVVLTLPVPLGNMLPAIAICLIALGILERDGLWVVIGLLTAALALFISAGVIYVLTRALLYIILSAFGLHAEVLPDPL